MKTKKNDPRMPPPDIVESVRRSAKHGAASLLGYAREDVIEEIAAITVEKYFVHAQRGPPAINNPRAWAYRVGKNEANAWIVRENRHVSIDAPSFSGDEQNQNDALFNRQELVIPERSSLRGQEEILEALPELFQWFQVRVVNKLDREDRLFYERYYVDRWSEAQIAAALKISPKAVAQRWRRLLIRLRRNLVRELPGWNQGNELFGDAFKDPKSLADLLCLIRLYVEQGIDGIRGIVEAFRGK